MLVSVNDNRHGPHGRRRPAHQCTGAPGDGAGVSRRQRHAAAPRRPPAHRRGGQARPGGTDDLASAAEERINPAPKSSATPAKKDAAGAKPAKKTKDAK